MTMPLMPKATAVWLIEKTALTFTQIADFCGMHPLEVQAIADGEVAQGIVGYDPVANSQVTADEIRRCEADPNARLKLAPTALPMPKRLRGSRYTPVAKRNDRPDAIAFLLRNYPQLTEAQVGKLLGTTKETIQKVRERIALEQRQHQAARSGDPGAVQPDRPERRGRRRRTSGWRARAAPSRRRRRPRRRRPRRPAMPQDAGSRCVGRRWRCAAVPSLP